jgi:hypothetical protein
MVAHRLLYFDPQVSVFPLVDGCMLKISRVNDLGVNDDTEIDWKTLRDDTWNLWSAHMLQRRWTSMKRGIDGYENIPHSGVLYMTAAEEILTEATTTRTGRYLTRQERLHVPK